MWDNWEYSNHVVKSVSVISFIPDAELCSATIICKSFPTHCKPNPQSLHSALCKSQRHLASVDREYFQSIIPYSKLLKLSSENFVHSSLSLCFKIASSWIYLPALDFSMLWETKRETNNKGQSLLWWLYSMLCVMYYSTNPETECNNPAELQQGLSAN